MPDPRYYKVLAVREVDAGAPPEFADLGVHEGDRAERAVEKAVDAGGDAGIARCIAVPIGNWTECTVEEDTRPRFKARRVEAEAPTDEPADPDPDPDPAS
jgi:hypothetical protein